MGALVSGEAESSTFYSEGEANSSRGRGMQRGLFHIAQNDGMAAFCTRGSCVPPVPRLLGFNADLSPAFAPNGLFPAPGLAHHDLVPTA